MANRKVAVKPKPGTKFSFKITGHQIQFYKNHRLSTSMYINVEGVDISCGVMQVDGVSKLNWALEKGIPYMTVKKAFVEFIKKIKDNGEESVAFVLVSNNNTQPRVNRILDALSCAKTEWKKNPQTERMIKVWTI